MMRYLVLALYLATLVAVVYGWWPSVHKLAFVEEGTIYAGWDALGQMLPLLVLIALTVGLVLTIALLAAASWASGVEDDKTEAAHRKRERAIEERGQEIMARARKEVEEAQGQAETYRQRAEQAVADEKAAKLRAAKVREESERAHSNTREQLKRYQKQNAKLREH